ncbi:hypothetical protein [Psychrobacillus sp.]|uniref:hypothetical protein n=1 Tax=Psychrobacillus sp. TaxID=1871623 RepID=UPI0028BF06BB|nr:hypothetical protein [Psychrobacillus sp.]
MSERVTIIYIEVEREIDFYYQMQQIRVEQQLHLTLDGIATANHQFKLHHVLDVSHKPFSFGGGMLYLHTNQGVFTYKIEEDPSYFIHTYNSFKTKL